MVTVPPPGMASRALTTRLMMALPSCASSACTVHRSGSRSTFSVMPSPTRRRSICASSPITSPSASSLGLHGLLAAEGQQLAHQGGGAQRVLVDLVDLLEGGIARLVAHQQEFAIADDDGEQIVEVMRHAARQLAHRLHLLRLGEFGLQRLLLGDIHQIKHRLAARGMGLAKSSAMRSSPPARLGAAQLHRLAGRSRRRRRCAISASTWARSPASTSSAKFLPASAPEAPKNWRQRRIGVGDARRRHRQRPRPWARRGTDRRHCRWPGAAGSGAATAGAGAAAAARLRTGCGEVLAARRGREPPGGLLVGQRAHRGDDLQPRHHRESFPRGRGLRRHRATGDRARRR